MLTCRTAIAAAALLVAALTGCAYPAGFYTEPTQEPTAARFVLASPDLDTDGYLPDSARGNVEAYCGDGDNVSPNLEWTGVPARTESFVLLMTDPNYPSFDHWVVTGIPGNATSLAGAVDGAVELGVVGTNSRGPGDYVGPCRADNEYRYTLYALDAEIGADASTTLDEARELMLGHVLAEAFLLAKRH